MSTAKDQPRSARQRDRAVRNLHFGVRLSSQLANRLDDFCDATAILWMVIAQSAPVGVPWELPCSRDQVSFFDKAPTLPFGAEAQIFQLHNDHDGEVIVDGCILNITRSQAGTLERNLAGS